MYTRSATNQIGGIKVENKAAAEARREYKRNWAKRNPEKVKAYQERYWTKRAAEQATNYQPERAANA